MLSSKRPHTLFIEEDEREGASAMIANSATEGTSALLARSRLPIKRTPVERLVHVISGSPWNHYDKRSRVKYWCSFGLVTSKATRDMFMIRTVTHPTESLLADLCRLHHRNITQINEIYCFEGSHYLVAEFMATSLLNIHRSPAYPTEPQLGSLIHQVGSSFQISYKI